jgi:hypothetical protein
MHWFFAIVASKVVMGAFPKALVMLVAWVSFVAGLMVFAPGVI